MGLSIRVLGLWGVTGMLSEMLHPEFELEPGLFSLLGIRVLRYQGVGRSKSYTHMGISVNVGP